MRALALLLAALVLAGCATPAPPSSPSPALPPASPSSPSEGKGPAWSFTAIDDGQTYSRDAPAGNATVLFFMATWCSSCRSKAPLLAAVAEDYTPRGVRTYSIDFDPSETKDDIRAWQERYGHHWPHGIDEGRGIQRAFSVTAQSSVVVLDADGNLVERFGYGQVTERALRAALDSTLAA